MIFKIVGLSFSSRSDWGSYIISIAKPASLKNIALICLRKFLSPEYCCHARAGAPSSYLELLDKLPKWICRTVAPSLAASLEPLTHCWNIASLSFFYRYYFGICSSELAQLVPLLYSQERSTCYSDRLNDFSVTNHSCYKNVYDNIFYPCRARFWTLSLELTDTF